MNVTIPYCLEQPAKVACCALLLFSQLILSGQTPGHPPEGDITLKFMHVAGERSLSFDSTYINPFGEQYTVNKFRYYISNITFVGNAADTKTIRLDTTILVDETKPASKEITLTVPEGSYNAITFLLGVDSIKNVSGAQSGALDPLQDMFWTWSTGYVMAKLEGNSPL